MIWFLYEWILILFLFHFNMILILKVLHIKQTNRVTRRYQISKQEETFNVRKIGPFQTTQQKNKNKEQGPTAGKSSPTKTNP